MKLTSIAKRESGVMLKKINIELLIFDFDSKTQDNLNNLNVELKDQKVNENIRILHQQLNTSIEEKITQLQKNLEEISFASKPESPRKSSANEVEEISETIKMMQMEYK